MRNPFALMAVLFAALAAVMAIQSALAGLGLVSVTLGLPWLRVHLVTLGVLAQVIFGFLPVVVAVRSGQDAPPPSWSLWLTLNTGLVTLMMGIPMVSAPLIATGGALILAATLLLLRQIQPVAVVPHGALRPSARFYLVGLGFLLVGVTVGTGLWLGWSSSLHIAVPREAHIHANAFGFMALTFTGLLLDLRADFAPEATAPSSRAVGVMFWAMSLGALGLVIGPWLDARPIMLGGVLLHLVATGTLLVCVVMPIVRAQDARQAGPWHLALAYVWFLLPIVAAPLIVLNLLAVTEGRVEARAPQALTFGWMLQFGFAVVPYALRRLLCSEGAPRLGGSWMGLLLVNLGCALIWVSMVSAQYDSGLMTAGYACWAIALLASLLEWWAIMRPPAEASTAAV